MEVYLQKLSEQCTIIRSSSSAVLNCGFAHRAHGTMLILVAGDCLQHYCDCLESLLDKESLVELPDVLLCSDVLQNLGALRRQMVYCIWCRMEFQLSFAGRIGELNICERPVALGTRAGENG